MEEKEKHYCLNVIANGDGITDAPKFVTFDVDKETAVKIVGFSEFVVANDLYKVEKFDCRAAYYTDETADGHNGDTEDDDESRPVRTEMDMLNVSDTEFWFSARHKFDDIEFTSDPAPISELKEFFGI